MQEIGEDIFNFKIIITPFLLRKMLPIPFTFHNETIANKFDSKIVAKEKETIELSNQRCHCQSN